MVTNSGTAVGNSKRPQKHPEVGFCALPIRAGCLLHTTLDPYVIWPPGVSARVLIVNGRWTIIRKSCPFAFVRQQ